MSGIERIIERILALRPELTREAVLMMIEEEKRRAGGLLTDEAAAHIVASTLGARSGRRVEAEMKIGRLTSGLGDVSITGRVIHIFPPKRFVRRDGREGKVVRMLLGDGTGSVRVVLWDEKADLISAGKVQPGKIVRILHGYTRERQGEVEVNVGRRGELYMEPMGVKPEEYPPLEEFFLEPGGVHEAGRVNLIGVVVEKSPVSTFMRRDGQEGRVMRMRLSDLKGGEVTLVLWDDRVEDVGEVEVGTRLKIVEGRARRRVDGRIEVHISKSTWVEVVEEGVEITTLSRRRKIGEIRAGMRDINLLARVVGIGRIRTFERRDGSEGRVASLLLQDDSGSVRLSLWDDDVDLVERVREGDTIYVERAYAREGLGGLSLSLGSGGRVAINPELGETLPMIRGRDVTKIEDLREGMGDVTVEGKVVEEPSLREVTTRRGETVKVASFVIDDGTGEARVSVWRELAEKVEGLPLGVKVRIENCYVRPSYTETKEVTSGTFTKIRIEDEA